MAMIEALKSAKLNRHRIQFRVTAQDTINWCEPLVECYSTSHSTRCGQHYWRKCCMLNLTHLLVIVPSLFLLMLAIYRWKGAMSIWSGARVEDPSINKCFSNLPPQNPCISTSNWALSSMMAEQWDKDSPESGCRWGTVVTLWQTSVSSMAVMSLTSLGLTAGKPPVLQVRACSTLNGCPQLQWAGKFWSGQPYLRESLGCRWKQPCAERSHSHQWGVLLAKWRLPFP